MTFQSVAYKTRDACSLAWYNAGRGGAAIIHTNTIPGKLYHAIEEYAARQGDPPEAAIRAWAENLHALNEPEADGGNFVYDPAGDPLAGFLGKGELTSPDAIRRQDSSASPRSRAHLP